MYYMKVYYDPLLNDHNIIRCGFLFGTYDVVQKILSENYGGFNVLI